MAWLGGSNTQGRAILGGKAPREEEENLKAHSSISSQSIAIAFYLFGRGASR